MAKVQFEEIKLIVPWGHVAARTYGSRAGEPVLMVHGREDNAGTFTRLMKYLPMESFYYVCIDLPGHGWSSHFPSWMTLSCVEYANALHFILKALQWQTCIYIGHSMGAQIGIIFSVIEPHRLKKLICLDGFLFIHKQFDKDTFINYYKQQYAYMLKGSSNVKPPSYTKEEILYAFKNKRLGNLNSEAADALFERAATEVNGKYILNRDVRTKSYPFLHLNLDECRQINCRISAPLYMFIASESALTIGDTFFQKIKDEVQVPITNFKINGNHDVHNNNPEKIAPYLCEVLNTGEKSKL